MKLRRLILYCLLITAFVTIGCAPAKAPRKAETPSGYQNIRIVGSSLGGKATTAAMVFATVFNKYYPEIEWSSCSGSSASSAIYLTKGDIRLAFLGAIHYVAAYGFDKIAESRLRSVNLPTSTAYYLFVIPEDKPWKDITEVPKGANLCAGTPGAAPTACETWLQLCGLTKKDFNWLVLGQAEMADAWRAGKLDVAFVPITGLAPSLLDMQTSPRKIKAMGLSPEQAARAKAEKTFERIGYSGVVMSGIVELCPEIFKYDVVCPQQPSYLCCRDDFPEDIAYKTARVIDEHNAELAQMFATMKYATPQYHIKFAGPPMEIHPGVAKYYKEKGYLN